MSSSRLLVLLVDHDVRTTRTLAQMLREDGYEVERVPDGAAAIGRLAREPIPDVLVTEITLPYVDGAAVARYARSRHPKLPVVVVTNHPDLLGSTTWSFAPPPIVLTKPIDYAAFAGVLAELGASALKLAAAQ